MRVSAPGSTANIGPGFDVLALAVDRRYELADHAVPGFEPVGPDDLVWSALHATGSEPGPLWYRSAIPEGRGLGSSAAALVAAAYLGLRADGVDDLAARDAAFTIATDLEGHGDNAAAATFGGLALVRGRVVHRDAPAIDGTLHLWVPAAASPTAETRRRLAPAVSVDDAVAQAAACAAVYAGLLTGSWPLLRAADGDRVHEAARLEDLPRSRAVLEALRADGHVAWLSGSGPGVASLVEPGREPFTPAEPGEWLTLGVDLRGCGQDE